MRDKRKLERRETDAFLGVYDRKTELLIGQLMDMTTDGMKIKCVATIELDSTYLIRVDLPVETKWAKEVTFSARCVWTKKCSESDAFDSGFRMHNSTPIELENISKLISSRLFENLDETVRVTLKKIVN